ncbi:DUF397 domain-containing protein [Actinokineospora auranticolor]|uniref:Uncharacterized protein DUF397 n=1 Tax=Actinokineospora auranticolor TaxID=155976 RepID=A0A2S6GHW2_9PSEU|nr:DUF397 domain-containing protein [Actinokineospora auranticolor]PPK64736.1 uncharacterized protein DUF397 [Actinokineospora auranticolor]
MPTSTRFKKSSFSAANSDCVEVDITRHTLRDSKNPGQTLTGDVRGLIAHVRYRKSSFSGGNSNCVEIAPGLRAVRDSKHHRALACDVRALVRFVRSGQVL